MKNLEVLKKLGIVALAATTVFYLIGLYEYIKLKITEWKQNKESKIEKED